MFDKKLMMQTINTVYENVLGITYELYNQEKKSYVILEIGCVSFMINHNELRSFINSMRQIIEHHKGCTCPKELKNKMVVYKAENTEIRMMLSFDELYLLKDLLKGTKFKLEMGEILKDFRIN